MKDTVVQWGVNLLPLTTHTPDTGDYTVTVEWEGMDISSGVFSQSVLDGDHNYICTAASGVIEPKYKGRTKSVTVKGISIKQFNKPHLL